MLSLIQVVLPQCRASKSKRALSDPRARFAANAGSTGTRQKIADGAALMTETTVKSDIVSGDANLIGNPALEQLMQRELDRLGPPVLMSRIAKPQSVFRQH